MSKIKFEIEYLLSNASAQVLWRSIGTPQGLSEWFSDGVTVEGEAYCFLWDKHEQSAKLLESKTNQYIRFQWDEDEGTDYYFEIKMSSTELSKELSLLITDFAEEDEVDDSKLLWNQQVETLLRKLGI